VEKNFKQQLCKCDKTGLNFKTIPSKSLAPHKTQSAPGFKRVKGQVMLMLAYCNASGNY
jgi:hypothetical protein